MPDFNHDNLFSKEENNLLKGLNEAGILAICKGLEVYNETRNYANEVSIVIEHSVNKGDLSPLTAKNFFKLLNEGSLRFDENRRDFLNELYSDLYCKKQPLEMNKSNTDILEISFRITARTEVIDLVAGVGLFYNREEKMYCVCDANDKMHIGKNCEQLANNLFLTIALQRLQNDAKQGSYSRSYTHDKTTDSYYVIDHKQNNFRRAQDFNHAIELIYETAPFRPYFDKGDLEKVPHQAMKDLYNNIIFSTKIGEEIKYGTIDHSSRKEATFDSFPDAFTSYWVSGLRASMTDDSRKMSISIDQQESIALKMKL